MNIAWMPALAISFASCPPLLCVVPPKYTRSGPAAFTLAINDLNSCAFASIESWPSTSIPISRQRSSKRSAMPLPYTSLSSRMYTFFTPRFLAQSAESGPWRSSAGTTRV